MLDAGNGRRSESCYVSSSRMGALSSTSGDGCRGVVPGCILTRNACPEPNDAGRFPGPYVSEDRSISVTSVGMWNSSPSLIREIPVSAWKEGSRSTRHESAVKLKP